MPTLSELNIRIGADISELRRGLTQAERRLRRTSRTLGDLGDAVNRNLVAPFLAASGVGVKLALDLDRNFSKIENLVGITGDSLESFRDSVKSISNQVGKSQTELSQALFTVTSAGLRGSEAVQVLTASAKASVVGLGETEEIARATTAVIQAYGKENISASRAVNVLTSTVREGNLEASSLAPVLGNVIGLASQMGISFEEVGANIATFTRLGVSAEEAVTGLQSVMSTFLKPSEKAEETLLKFGLSAEKVRQMIAEQGLAQTLVMLTERFKGNEAALAEVIPNIRALRSVMGTAGAQGESYLQILEGIEKQTSNVDEAFSRASDRSSAKFARALENLKNAAIELGTDLLPVITKVVEKARDLAIGFQNLDPGTRKFIANLGIMVTVGGGALKLISGMGATAVTLLRTVKLLAPAISTLRIGLAALGVSNPFIALAAGAGALIALLPKLQENIRKTGSVKDLFQAPLLPGQQQQRPNLPQTKNLGTDIFPQEQNNPFADFIDGASKADKTVQDLADSLDDLNKKTKESQEKQRTLADVLKDLKDGLQLARAKSEVFTDTFPVGAERMELYRAAINELLELGFDPMTEEVQDLKRAIDGLDRSTKDQIETLPTLKKELEVTTSSFGSMKEAANSVNEAAVKNSEKLANQSDFLDGMVGKLEGGVLAIGEGIINAAASGEKGFKNLAKAAGEAAKAFIRTAIISAIQSAIEKLPFPANLFAAAGAAVTATALFAAVPKARKGAIVSGPTQLIAGDNPNARIDPEVIAPLSKLKSMLGDQTMTVQFNGRLIGAGSDLLGIIDEAIAVRIGTRGF